MATGSRCFLFYLSERYEIILSQDPRRICEFLGLSYERLQHPFNNGDEVVNFLSESPYFDRGVYHPDAGILSHEKRRRRQRRPINQELTACLMDPDIPYVPKDCDKIHQLALEFFDKVNEFEQYCQSIQNKFYYHQRINGKLVGDLTGLDGNQLGKLMRHIRDQISTEQLRDLDDSELATEILKLVKMYDPNSS